MIPVFPSEEKARFAIGRVQSGAAAGGGVEPRPWVRWDGLPGRRSHTSKTPWALGFDSTVRIGAGAWRKPANTQKSGDTDQAQTHLHHAEGNRNGKKKERKLLRRKRQDGIQGKRRAAVIIETPPLARATALHSVALRAATLIWKERKNLAD